MIQEAGQLLFGRDYVRQLAEALGVSRRVVQRWQDGSEPVPIGVWADLRFLLIKRSADCGRLGEQIDAAGLLQ